MLGEEKMSLIKSCIKRIGLIWPAYIQTIICIFIVFLVTNFVYMNTMLNDIYANMQVSWADIYIINASGFYIYILVIPISIISYIVLNNKNYTINNIVRYKNFFSIMCDKLISGMAVSLITSVIIVLISTISAYSKTSIKINFNYDHSIFSFNTNGNTMDNPCLIYIIAICFLYYFLIVYFFVASYILIDWIINNSGISFVLVIIYSVMLLILKIGMLYDITYLKFYKNKELSILLIIPYIILVIIIGSLFSKRKEVLNA